MNTKNSLKVVLLSLFLLSAESSFSYDPDESDTEAGSPCTTQNCPQKTPLSSNLGERDLIEFSTDDLLCKKMQKRPECKGEKKEFLKGCSSDEVFDGIKGCGLGMFDGLLDYLVSTYKLTKEFLVDKENSTIKSYFHAEFENASQDAGTFEASIEAVRPVLQLYFDALRDVNSCLNDVGLVNMACHYVIGVPLVGMTTAVLARVRGAAAFTMFLTGAGFIGYQIGSEITELMTDDEDSRIAGGVAGTALGVGLIFSKYGAPLRNKLSKFGRIFTTPVTVIGSMTVLLTGSDKRVRERVKQRMIDKIKEHEANKLERKRERIRQWEANKP